MSEYTAEDFKNARFAEHEDWGTAARTDDPKYPLWFVAKMGEPWFMEDHEMAESGWRPVVEVEDPEAVVALIGRLAVREAASLTLDTLREAWENAEVPTADRPIRVGDECIMPLDDLWMVGLEGDDWMPSHGDDARVLRRAPQPEPRQALADVLRTTGCDGQAMDPKILASVLHERGVRVTGGDET